MSTDTEVTSKNNDFYKAIDELQKLIFKKLPNDKQGRERALAITHLQEVENWVNRGLAGGRIEVM